MMEKNRKSKNQVESAVRMAVRAVEDDRSPLDIPVAGVDPSPGALDLPEMEQPCSRCGRPAEDTCPECGSPLCEDCVSPSAAGDEDWRIRGAHFGVADDHAEGVKWFPSGLSVVRARKAARKPAARPFASRRQHSRSPCGGIHTVLRRGRNRFPVDCCQQGQRVVACPA
jgi:hypothetical protein